VNEETSPVYEFIRVRDESVLRTVVCRHELEGRTVTNRELVRSAVAECVELRYSEISSGEAFRSVSAEIVCDLDTMRSVKCALVWNSC
jgi:hypothetical protein